MKNPFYFRELPLDAPFCNREGELKELTRHATNQANVVLFSPRRYGKTSLIKRVQNILRKKGVFTVYVDFYGVSSINDIGARLTSRIYAVVQKRKSVLEKIMSFLKSWRPVFRPDPEYGLSVTAEPATGRRGLALLDDTMKELGRFIEDQTKGCNIVFDEFQEIVDLKEPAIEGIMRSHISTHANASYFFVGSRRRILNDIFFSKKRPFYRSAIDYELKPLPMEDASHFIVNRFKENGKVISADIAKELAMKVKGYPYYIQRIAYTLFEISGRKVTHDDYLNAIRQTIDEEKYAFESMLKVLAPQQISLLKAIAKEPTGEIFSTDYIAKHSLRSIGGVQGALKKLTSLDYIEELKEDKGKGFCYVVDPLFSIWLKHLEESRNDS